MPTLSVGNLYSKSLMEHDSNDLVVFSNGTVWHKVFVNAEVNCGINLFNYPFAYDVCPVGLKSTPPGGKPFTGTILFSYFVNLTILCQLHVISFS